MKKKLLLILKISVYIIIGLFIFLSIIPYLLPINNKKADTAKLPFSESRFVKIDNKLWHYRKFEPKTEKKGTIVLVHGFSGSTFSWRNNQEVFADSGYLVFSFDMPAFGYSEKENNRFDHSAQAQAKSIWRIIDSIESVQDKISVFGHSMGAGIAWMMAGQRPEMINNVYLVDGAGQFSELKSSGFLASLLNITLKYPPLLRWVDVMASNFYLKQHKFEELLSSAYGQKADSVAAAGYLAPFLLKNSGRAIIEGFLYSQNHAVPDFSKLNAPVHLIWGTKDAWVPISVADKFKERYQKAILFKIEGAGHCPMETHAKIFNDFIFKTIDQGL
jgi:2-hydroxy-6-oxonona-2,4-dienedioate hydrolase